VKYLSVSLTMDGCTVRVVGLGNPESVVKRAESILEAWIGGDSEKVMEEVNGLVKEGLSVDVSFLGTPYEFPSGMW